MIRAALLVTMHVACVGAAAAAGSLTPEELAARVTPPYELGEPTGADGVWTIVDAGGGFAGYVFRTEPLAPIPGFSGAPIDMLVTLDREGRFLDVAILDQNEPVFVSGLGPEPFHAFVRQYRGRSIHDPITIGSPYGAAEATTANVYLDGVTKATASVRIANETVLAAALAVAREKMKGFGGGPAAAPDPAHDEPLDWAAVAAGVAARLTLTNADAEAAFAGTRWSDDDPEAAADPDGLYLDLLVVDVGPPAVARAVLDAETRRAVERLRAVAPQDEPVLLLARGRHPLVSDRHVRNTAPDRLSASQAGLPLALRDADIEPVLAPGAPDHDQAMIVRLDRRLGFDPASPWTLSLRAVRAHGSFMPEFGVHDFTVEVRTPGRFFARPAPAAPESAFAAALRGRAGDIAGAGVLAGVLFFAMATRLRRLASHPRLPAIRAATLIAVAAFLGWKAQAQLSIVTPLAVVRAAAEGGSFAFLAYDPVSGLVWVVCLASLLLWGRGFFCGWLCPYGAMQELATHAGRAAGVRERRVPPRLDRALRRVKYGVLATLGGAALAAPAVADRLVEVEPFKTAVTVMFVRETPYALYATGWLLLSVLVFKAFCRYVCPLGALLALLGRARLLGWIPRRPACGAPCRLCEVRCRYGAIARSGRIDYAECFQCLDCVTIHDDPQTCVPLVLAARRPAPPAAA